MLELWQTEWCPASRRVRERLTELGVDFVVRQVPVEPARREVLRRVTGAETIPVLCPEDGPPLVGEQAIVAWLGEHVEETSEAAAHRDKAAKARRRYLEEACKCSEPATR